MMYLPNFGKDLESKKKVLGILAHVWLGPSARCHCVCFVMTHRLISNMTYLGHSSGQVT